MSSEIGVDSPSTSGRKVRACRTCAIAKAKCVPQGGHTGGQCGRCHRLGKECSGQTPSSKHLPRKHTRIEELERKLDSLLAAQSWPPGNIPSLAVPPPAPSTVHLQSPQGTVTTGASISHHSKAECPTDPLDIFHSELAKHCPWVIIPSNIDSTELSRQKPFLFKTVCAAASYRDLPRQMKLERNIKEYLGQHLFTKCEKSLDLLQGLLVAITWHQLYMSQGAQLTNLLHLAMAQVAELGLSRRLHASDRQRSAISGLQGFTSEEESSRNQLHSLDGPRAYLGCFYFSSVISMCIKKMDPMLYIQRTDECCRLLTERGELPSDTYLVHQVQLHRIGGRIGQKLPFEEPGDHFGAFLQPIQMCVKSFQRDLQEFRESASVNVTEPVWSNSLLIHSHIVEMYLHEIGFQVPNIGDGSRLRLELLYSCLLSAKAFFDELFSIPATTLITSTYVLWAHMRHALTVLSKLSLLEDADWDLSHTRRVLDLEQVIDQVLVLNKELESQMVHNQNSIHDNMFTRVASQIMQLKERYVSRLAILEGRAASQPGVVNGSVQMNNTMLHGELFEGLDESFWQDVIADWNVFLNPV